MTFDRAFFIHNLTWQRTPLFRVRIDDGCAGALSRAEEIHSARVRDHARSSAPSTYASCGSIARTRSAAADQRRILLSIGQIEKRPSLAGELHEPSRSRRAGL